MARYVKQIILSGIILGILIYIIVNFYVFSSIVNLNSFFYAFLLLSVLIDGMMVLLHLPRKRLSPRKLGFNSETLTIVIACHNGENVIEQTIKGAATHVPLMQIIVVNDASTDRTGEIAKQAGVVVINNQQNLHKVGSIHAALETVKTPYVLILDDDTLIDKTFIPTSLLDDGYTAVAFNVMPVPKKTLLNELQRFEYRITMQMSKNLRSATGAIGNISGAIGLYRTSDLKKQIDLHSGQFAGEDEQRTLLAHMYGEGKGITYVNSLVLTHAPDSYLKLFRQRAFSWSISSPELLYLYFRTLLSPRYHYLLKTEKAYLIYIYLTEPLRILFIWTLFLKPEHFLLTYGFYLLLDIILWIKIGGNDTFRAVVLSPLYTLLLVICRIIGYFYWLKVKILYLAKRSHLSVERRHLLAEYCLVLLLFIGSWAVSIEHFRNNMNIYTSLKSNQLNNNGDSFNYTSTPPSGQIALNTDITNPDNVTVIVDPGDNMRALAHKAINQYLLDVPNALLSQNDYTRYKIDMWLASRLPSSAVNDPGLAIAVPKALCQEAITANA